jgi:hypothetical protein
MKPSLAPRGQSVERAGLRSGVHLELVTGYFVNGLARISEIARHLQASMLLLVEESGLTVQRQ